MKRKIAVATASFLVTLALGRGALVSISTNATLGGNAVAPVTSPTSALQQEFWAPTHFHTNVFLHDNFS